jgi:hypothetical protein
VNIIGKILQKDAKIPINVDGVKVALGCLAKSFYVSLTISWRCGALKPNSNVRIVVQLLQIKSTLNDTKRTFTKSKLQYLDWNWDNVRIVNICFKFIR